MRTITFANRCCKEILRDPVNLGFGLGFPLVFGCNTDYSGNY